MATKKTKEEKTFKGELIDLCKKYNLRNCSFAGTDKDNKLQGFVSFDNYLSIEGWALSIANIARIYQHGREAFLRSIDKLGG